MGIDLTKLRTSPKTGDDVVKRVLDDVFQDSITKQDILKDAEPEPAGQVAEPEILPDGSLYTGDMYYQGKKMKVGDKVDKDGNTFVVDESNNLYQIPAKELKPYWDVPGLAEEKEKDVSLAEQQKGFWHTYLGDMLERMWAGVSDFSGSFYSLADKADKLYSYTNPLAGVTRKMYEAKNGGRSWLKEVADGQYAYAQTMRNRSDRYAGKDYEKLYDEGRYGDMVGEVFLTASESLPQSTIAMIGGPAGLAVTGASSGVQKYDQLDRMPETKDMPEGLKVLNAVCTGTFEAFSEKFGDVKVGQAIKAAYQKFGKETGEKLVEDGVSAFMTKMFKKYGVLWMPAAEGIEEVASQVAENVTDYCTGVTDNWNPFEGGMHSFIYGAAGGAQFAGATLPAYGINQYKKLDARRNYRKSRENVRKAFSEDKDVDVFTNGLTFVSPAEQEGIIGNLARNGKVTKEQINTVVDFANKANVYKSYLTPEAKVKERKASQEATIQSMLTHFDERMQKVTNEAGKIQEVRIIGRENEGAVYIVKGDIVPVEGEGGNQKVDVGKSSPELYYKDKDGKMQVTTPAAVEVAGIDDVAALRQEFEGQLRGRMQEKEAPANGQPETEEAERDNPVDGLENGKEVVYTDKIGKQQNGIIADAFSSPEYVFLEDGTAVSRKDISEVRDAVQEDVIPEAEAETNKDVRVEEKQEGTGQPEVAPTLPETKEVQDGKSFEIEEGLVAREQADGSFLLNSEFAKSELEKGKKLVERLNKDFEETGQMFELVQLPKRDEGNRFEKPKWGVVVRAVDKVKSSEKVEPITAAVRAKISQTKFDNPERVVLVNRGDGRYYAMYQDANVVNRVTGAGIHFTEEKEQYVELPANEEVVQRLAKKGYPAVVVDVLEKPEQRDATIQPERKDVPESPTRVVLKKKDKPRVTARRFAERDNKLGEYVSVRDLILRGIATGQFRFVWNDRDVRRGISKELGFADVEKERRRRFWMFDNTGYSVDGLAQHLSEASDWPSYGMNTEDLRNEIIDVMNVYDTPNTMIEAAEVMRENGEEVRARFFAEMTDEERDWYNQMVELRDEFEREAEAEMPEELLNEILTHGATEKEIKELHSTEDFIKFVERSENGNKESSELGADPAEMDGSTGEGENTGEVAGAVTESEDTGGSTETEVSVESPGYDAPEAGRIADEVNAAIDRQVRELRQRLSDRQKELKRKKEEVGKAYTEDKQLALFTEEKFVNPLDTGRDFSEGNLSGMFEPIQQEIKNLEGKIRELEGRREKVVRDAVEAELRQGRLFADEDVVKEAKPKVVSREDIENCNADEQQKDMALDYLAGEDSVANKLAFLSIQSKIQNSEQDDRDRPKYIERGSQRRRVGKSAKQEVLQPDLFGTGEGGGSNLSSHDGDSRAGGGKVQGDGTGQAVGRAGDNGTRDSRRSDEFSVGDGVPGVRTVSSKASGIKKSVDSGNSGGSGRTSGHGAERVSASGGETGNSRGNEKVTERGDNTGRDSEANLDTELDSALSDLDKALNKFKQGGKNSLNLSLAGLTSEQIEAVGEIIAAGAKVGYVLLRKGIHAVGEWTAKMKELIGGRLRGNGLNEADVEELIRSMWEAKVRDADGNRKKISEFAKEYGVAPEEITTTTPPQSFQDKIKIALEKQRAAERIGVELCDPDNIRETLPMLLPEQQDDVVKAENRFFSGESKKGMLFTNGTGTGKTYTGLGVIKRFARQGRNDILIVVPSSEKVKDWVNDGRNLLLDIKPLRDTKDGGRGICITTYANFRENEELKRRVFDLVVYDESHRLMESAGGSRSNTTSTHFKISNKDVAYASQRLLDLDEDYKRTKEISRIIDEIEGKKKKGKKKDSKEKETDSGEKKEADKKRIGELEKERDACMERWEARELEREEQAKKDVAKTRVVFLSATPFKGIFNLRYADGYLFDFPERTYAGYNTPTGEDLFYIQYFGSKFEMKYGRLQQKSKPNAEAISMQEIEFQQMLTREGAMSGRAIESNADYSREFVKPHSDKFNAELFNDGLNAIYDFEKDEFDSLREAANNVFFSYNYTTRLMETLKASLFIPRIEQHLELGRKVVLFHRRKQANVSAPFASILSTTKAVASGVLRDKEATPDSKADAKKALEECERFRNKFSKLLEYERTLSYSSAIDQVVSRFGEERVKLFNGDITKRDKSLAVENFNNDNSGVDVIMIQEESGKEGISLHDRTGKHQRVLMSLSAPISSITALQIEGRIYRIGQETNAIFEYPTLGLDSELVLFGQTINRKLSTTENLALGDSARDLIRAFAEGIESWSDDAPGTEQGKGGKEADFREKSVKSPFEKAVLRYFTNQKNKKKREHREGVDFYATPEPVGMKMVEWCGMRTGEWLLEPSAGAGAIAEWTPANCGVVAIEPSLKLFARLGGHVSNGSSKLLNMTFEEHDIINKYDVIAMNPPFGVGGATAMQHIEKAFKHLRNGGRLVALIPRGAMDKKLDNFLYGDSGNPEAMLAGEVLLPGITFEQAGTGVNCRIVVIDKIGEGAISQVKMSRRIELDNCKTIDELFERIENVSMPPRAELTKEAKVKNTPTPLSEDSELASAVEVTKHTKTNEDLFVVKLSRKVENEVYKDIKKLADDNSGFWSRFVNGFIFKSAEEAEAFRTKVNAEEAGEAEVRFRRNLIEGAVFYKEKERVLSEIIRLEGMLKVRVNVVENRGQLPEAILKQMETVSRYPGVFAVGTGEVYAVLDEIADEAEAQRTVFHEVVGHKGMRGVFGAKYGEFCERVLGSLNEQERATLVREYKGDRYLAADEYVARFAEEYRELSAWEKVKGVVRNLLYGLGIRLKLNDSDLMYLLWKGANRLKNGDSALVAIDKVARDEVMFREIRKEDEATKVETAAEVDVTDEDKLKLHNEVVSRKFRFAEAYQDRMLSVKRLQELIEHKAGIKIPSYMDAYLFENTLASRNTYEIEHFRHNELRRMTNGIAALEKGGMTRREVENYILCKHGLERNEYMRRKKVEEWYRPQVNELERQKERHSAEWFQREMMLLDAEKAEKEVRLANVDFSGLTEVVKELGRDADTYIEEVEGSHKAKTEELWAGIRACTDLSLQKWFEAGMMNRKQLDQVKSIFKFYIPLRGFDEMVAQDVYEYFEDEDRRFNSPLRKANGRRSRPDTPFAFIVSLVESSIVGGNKNLMKLHLFRLAQKYPSGLMTVRPVWYKEAGKDAEGNPLYEMVLPVYDEDAERYRQNIEKFEEEMKELEQEEKAHRSRARLNVGYRLLYNEQEEHIVKVKQNGREYAILLNGDPRPAQAIEGLNDEERIDNKVVDAIRWMNRQMAANFTTRNPAFVASNMTRDLIFSMTTLGVKEGTKYRNRFVKNIPGASGAIQRYLRGKADRQNRMDVLFEEFLKNGGETGHTALYNIEKFKKMVDSAVGETRQHWVIKGGMKVLDFFASGNRWAEDLSRFAVYVTSREAGRDVLTSVRDAKEVTVNFNRKGSGAMGAQVFKSLYLFFNAAVQSLANFSQMYRKNRRGTIETIFGYAATGVLLPLLLRMLSGDDAEEEYLNLPDYVRKNNFCFYLGKERGFITFPLPIELRAFHSIGDAAYRYVTGRVSGVTASGETVLGLLDVLPLSPTGNSAPFIPDAMKPVAQAFYLNEDFTGRPIAKVTSFNKYDPEYRRVYRGTPAFFRKSAEVLNYFSGGDYATRGVLDKAGQVVSDIMSMQVNVTNPAAEAHILEEYLGGTYKTVMQLFRTAEDTYDWAVTGDNGVEARSIPILNRFYNRGSEYSTQSKINEQYFICLDELRETENRLRKYEEAAHTGKMDMETAIERCSDLMDNGMYERAKVIKSYSELIQEVRTGLNSGGVLSEEERAELESEELILKKQMLEELKRTTE